VAEEGPQDPIPRRVVAAGIAAFWVVAAVVILGAIVAVIFALSGCCSIE
jgi:hypothetical protein